MNIMANSTSAFYDRARSDMTSLRTQAEKLSTQISSQSRLTKSSDDPVAASRMRSLARADSLSKIDTANATRATADLSLADATMDDIAKAITEAKVLATQAANDTINDSQRASIGKQLEAIHSTIVGLVNTKDSSGHALFGGENATSAYTLNAAGNAVYTGTSRTSELPLGDGQTVTRSMTGPEFLNTTVNGQQTDIMATIKSLSDALQTGQTGTAETARSSLDALSAGLDAVTTGQTVVGSRLAWIDLTTERRTNMSEVRAGEESEVGGIDQASALVKLQELTTALSASQAAFTKLSQLSLFNQLT